MPKQNVMYVMVVQLVLIKLAVQLAELLIVIFITISNSANCTANLISGVFCFIEYVNYKIRILFNCVESTTNPL